MLRVNTFTWYCGYHCLCHTLTHTQTLRVNKPLGKHLCSYLKIYCFILFQGVTAENLYEKCPDLYKQLQTIDSELSGGCTAVVGLVFHNKLFVANVGKFYLSEIFTTRVGSTTGR